MEHTRFVSVICEYNPFHYGHLHQLRILKKEFGAVVCIMSGDAVQRGEIAVADKYIRAEAALNAGADLVLELPFPYCCTSAGDFARAGVFIAKGINSPFIAFGTEDGGELIKAVSEYTKTEAFSESLKLFSENNPNYSYPKAFAEAIREKFGEECAESIKKPNNILALEYLRFIGERITPYFVEREPSFASSTEIRSIGDATGIISALPKQSAEIYEKYKGVAFPREMKRIDAYFVGTLRAGSFEDDYYAVTPDLKNIIIKAAKTEATLEGITEKCKNKIYTAARVRRAVISLVFGITPEEVKKDPAYTCLLAASEAGTGILKSIKKSGGIKIITNPACAKKDEDIRHAFLKAKRAEDIFALAAPCAEGEKRAKCPVVKSVSRFAAEEFLN